VTVGAVVVRWRGGDEVDRCLRSLLAQPEGALSRITLVDSGSGDGGAARLARGFPDIEVLALEENRSFAHAANTGVTATDEELVLLLNPDTEIGPAMVAPLVEALRRRPEAAGVVPLLTNADGTTQHRWQLRRLPTVGRLATGRSGAPAFHQAPGVEAAVVQPAAAAWLIRCEVWQALGGFDETYAPAWWEDVDFCARMDRRLDDVDFPANEGFTVVPDATVRHLGGSSLGTLEPSFFLATFYANLVHYAALHHPDRLPQIRLGLKISLAGRALLRPSQAPTYLRILRSI
jgi:GT2 family glycosyltransferase